MSIGALKLIRMAAEQRLENLKNAYTQQELRDMSDADFEDWKANMQFCWRQVVDAERALFAAERDEEEGSTP